MTYKYFKKVYRSLFWNKHQKMVAKWFEEKGDKTLRLNYDLNENSVVFDLGGYEGQWASDIFARFLCTVHVFEPVPQFAEMIQMRFERNKQIVVHPFGLSDCNSSADISLAADGSSLFQAHGEKCQIVLRQAYEFIKESEIETIHLMKINIEGGEYDLLDHLIYTGFVNKIYNIQVQFHAFMPNAIQRRNTIQNQLSKTHHVTYNYPFVWENWTLMEL